MKKSNNYSNKSDVEVIEIYKNNSHWRTKQEIETHFYQKYSPLCKKYSYKYNYLSTMEDNMQECYFQLINALEYVDINKITNIESYSFGITLRGYVSSYFISQMSQYRDVYSIEDETTSYTTGVGSRDNKVNHIRSKEREYENNLIFNLYKEEFEETLPEKEKRLFQMLADGMKKKDIVKELGEKHTANLTYWINKIQKKYIAYTTSIGYEITM